MQLSIPHTEHKLSNGLTLLVHEDRRTPIVCVNLWYFVGSKDERPGRTGFAHLFEHLMFEGSRHVPKGQFDELLESAGGTNNGSTATDRTNYWETVPAGALELALHLESDRMGWLLETMTQAKLDGQRDVVKNERRQSYENRPYGLAYETQMKTLYPPEHPYHWPVIGWMQDLDAASLEDVRSFFETWYLPANAALAIAGDVGAAEAIELVEKYFGGIATALAPARAAVPSIVLNQERRVVLEDAVHLPRIYLAWHSPALFAPGDAEMDVVAEVLGSGKAARLYSWLVHELELAQDVEAFHNSGKLGSSLMVTVTAREGVEIAQLEEETRAVIGGLADDLTGRELERARNHIETATIDALQSVGGFGGKADRLNHYYFYTGTGDYIDRDLGRYRLSTPERARAELKVVLAAPPVVVMVLPKGRA
ncbi:MAG: M16 family metallopeptidase [Gemmatimonadota bacterium]